MRAGDAGSHYTVMGGLVEFFERLFASDFMPHGSCYFWQPGILWLNAISDGLITVAYYSIPLTLFLFVKKRVDPRYRGLVLMFAGFILACGTTHLLAVWNLWHSTYRLEGVVKAITAALSVATAFITLKLAPLASEVATPEETARTHQILRDEIEARKEAERQVLQLLENERITSEARIGSYFEAAPQAILAVTSDGSIRRVNGRTEEMFGYDRSELVGEKLEILLPERYRGGHPAHLREYAAQPRVRPMGVGIDLAGRRKDGSEFPVEIGLSYVPGDDGPVMFAAVSDITDRKRARDELTRVNTELLHSNGELEQFAYVASHDLQEPLRMITGYLQLLERRYQGRLDTDAGEFIHYAVDGAARMKRLILDLLSFSRVGTQAAQFRVVESETMFRNALTNLKAAIDESHAAITSDPLPSIVADQGLLTQVFQNLIGNGIKFQKSSQPQIHVSCVERDGSWVFSVKDNGIGIDPQHGDRIFRIFERLHGQDSYPGTGVGLAVTQKIVERHGGRIWLDPVPEGGTIFYFSIPCNVKAAQTDPRAAAPVATS